MDDASWGKGIPTYFHLHLGVHRQVIPWSEIPVGIVTSEPPLFDYVGVKIIIQTHDASMGLAYVDLLIYHKNQLST